MIWIIAVTVVVYLILGYIIAIKLVKEEAIDLPSEFWNVLLFWLVIGLAHAAYYIIKGVVFFPKKFADWHFEKMSAPRSKKP